MKHKIIILTLLLALGASSLQADVFKDRRRVEGRTNDASARELHSRGSDSGVATVSIPRMRATAGRYSYSTELNSASSYSPLRGQSTASTAAAGATTGNSVRDYRYGRTADDARATRGTTTIFSNSTAAGRSQGKALGLSSAKATAGAASTATGVSTGVTAGGRTGGKTLTDNPGVRTAFSGALTGTVTLPSYASIANGTSGQSDPWQDANEGASDPAGNADPWKDANEGATDPAPLGSPLAALALMAIGTALIKLRRH